MKRFAIALLSFGLLAGVSNAARAADAEVPAETYAAMGWYLRADAGWSWLRWSNNSDDSAAVFGGGVGYQYNDNLRADVRVDYAGKYHIGGGQDMSVTTVLGNLYYDIPTGSVITPYLGAGAGYGWGSVSNGPDRNGFAFALMAGAEMALTDNLSADLEYRYRHVMSSRADPQEHQVMIGLRYKF